MFTPLLATKFVVPPVSDRLVARPRLLEILDGGLRQDCLLTLVCAPAGYGKTTLVGSWLQYAARRSSSPLRLAWLTLEPGEDDLARFQSYLVAALRQIQPGVGQALLAALQTPRPPASQELATYLINDLAEIPGPFILVLDDYHTITAQPVHDFVTFLIEHQPPQMCLVIAARADPSLPLARLRARGQLVELRQDHLCFSLAETAEFINKQMGLDLSAAQLASLENRTEGWAAGLQLAALSLRHESDISAFIDTFSGGHVHIADYLTGEVLARQPEGIKSFLLQTSILERLTASLCEALTGQTQAQELLESLSEANLFLVPLDHQREWYRYHVLFGDLLRKRLHQTQGGLVDELHRRASRWYQDHALLLPAIEHALTGHDYRRAADLIAQTGEAILMHHEAVTLLRWLEALPANIQHDRPLLLIYLGLAHIMCGKPMDTVKASLEALAEKGEFNRVLGEYAMLRALLAILQGDAGQAIQLSNQALQELAPEQSFFRILAVDSLGMAYTLLGDSPAAARAFEQVAVIAEQTGNVMMALGALSNLAGLQVLQGQLRLAAESYQRVLDMAAARLGKHAPATGKALFGLGSLAREWNDLDGALRYYEEAVEMFKRSVEIGQSVAVLGIVFVKISQKDWEAAQKALEQARQLARSSTSTPLDDRLVEETQARFWVMQGKLEQAMAWVQSTGIPNKPLAEMLAAKDPRSAAVSVLNQATYLVLARIHLAKGQPEEALTILNPLADFLQNKRHMRRAVEVLALKALAVRQKDGVDGAVQVLDQALALAEPEGYQRTFLDEGEPMAQLLYQAAARGAHPEYAGKLLATFANEAPGRQFVEEGLDPTERLIEPLSDRELEVLALIAQGLSNREIAGRLVISLSTVKGHIAHVYSKLNVNSRTQALARARSLGLLPGS